MNAVDRFLNYVRYDTQSAVDMGTTPSTAKQKALGAALAEELGIPDNMMTSVYFICMENVNTLWEQLTSPYPQQLPPEDGASDGSQS